MGNYQRSKEGIGAFHFLKRTFSGWPTPTLERKMWRLSALSRHIFRGGGEQNRQNWKALKEG